MSAPIDRLFGLKALRFADLIGQQGRDAYDAVGVEIDAKLNSMVMTLTELGPSSSTEIAARTGFSRQLVESRIRKLEKSGYVTSAPDPEDARRRIYALAEDESKTLAQVHNVMADFDAVYAELWKEIGVDVSDAMDKAERALRKRPLTKRLVAQHPKYAKKVEETT